MLDSRPRIDLSSMIVYTPISWGDYGTVKCLASYETTLPDMQDCYGKYVTLTKRLYNSFLPVKDWDKDGFEVYTERKITIDNVELHVYHTGMGYVVYNETYAVLVTHIREVRQYDIKSN